MKKTAPKNQRQRKVSTFKFVSAWVQMHGLCAKQTFVDIFKSPVSTLITLSIFAVVLCLPVGLYWVGENLNQVTQHWEQGGEITVFLKEGVSNEVAQGLAETIKKRHDVGSVSYLTPDQALADFKSHSNLAFDYDVLDTNPLPGVFIIKPAYSEIETLETLRQTLSEEPIVATVQIDMDWVLRLKALVHFLKVAVWELAVLLGIGLLLIVGNTIRGILIQRHQEILVSNLVGASDAFVRRPFLYMGFWLGLCGSLLGLGIFHILGLCLAEPAQVILKAYSSSWHPQPLSGEAVFSIVFMACILGAMGAGVSVDRYLRQIRP